MLQWYAMVRIVFKSVLGELFAVFFLTLAFLNSVLMMEKILRLSRLLAGVGATLYDMAKIVLYLQPQILMLTIPMSLLLSILLVYGRMNIDNEITILRTAGASFSRISSPVMFFGAVCFLLSFAVSFSVGPASSIKLRQEITHVITLRSTLAVEEGTFNTAFKDLVILVKGKKAPDILEDIFIYDSRSKEEPRVLLAKEGRIFMQDAYTIGLMLKHGSMNITRGTTITELYFDAYKMALSLDTGSSAPKKIEFTPGELLRYARQAATYRERASYYLELDRRMSLPAVCLILVFLGPPLASMSGKSGRLGGLAIGLLVFALYYAVLIYGENLAMAGRIPHYVGAWAASVILGIVAFAAFRRESAK
jgi:lipopolysaccharide export system permease protein